jgi:uncharacterized protein (TIGR00730 family)
MSGIKGKNAWTALSIVGEYVDTVDKMEDIKVTGVPSVSIFGSARLKDGTPEYENCLHISAGLARLGYNIITGGGPGIMEAGNKGAYLCQDEGVTKTKSIGIGIELPFEAGNNDYININYDVSLKYFFIRKVMLTNYSDMYLAFTGGLGTLDEVFEVVTLMQTGKIEKRPVYLVGSSFWNPLLKWITDEMLHNSKTISEGDLDLITVIDSLEDLEEHLGINIK